MIEELGELNERFFELYGRLRENDELLTARQADFMANVLYDQYKQEYERLRLKAEISEKNELYFLQVKHSELIPKRRFLFMRNEAMKQADAELGKEIGEYFEERRRMTFPDEDGESEPETEENTPQRGETEETQADSS